MVVVSWRVCFATSVCRVLDIHVMDAASAEACSGRTKSAKVVRLRWSSGSASMSMRLEEIVAQLMRPVRDLEENFNCDISLLEEYLTEVGLRHLDGAREDFATIAMLVQQCATIYSKKVDFYEQSVQEMVERSHQAASTSRDDSGAGAEEEATETPSGRKRKRRSSGAAHDFAPIHLEPAPNIDREMGNIRPPPMLPKTYIEFERAPITESDARLTDYQGSEIGVVNDFHVNWNLKDGLLVDDLDSSAAISRDMVRPVIMAVLEEIRRISPPTSGSDSGIECSALEHHDDDATPVASQLPCPVLQKQVTQKRKSNGPPNTLNTKKRRSTADSKRRKALEKWWTEVQCIKGSQLCFEANFVLDIIEPKLLEGVQGQWYRNQFTRGLRMLATDMSSDFAGFPHGGSQDCTTSMRGFSIEEQQAARARRAAWLTNAPDEWRATTLLRGISDSEDDGFFDDSSPGDLTTATPVYLQAEVGAGAEREELSSRVDAWHALVAPRVAASEQHAAYDVHAYSAELLRRLPAAPQHFEQLVRGVQQQDISRYFLATLFLANTGNVEIVQTAPPLSINSFDVRLITRERSLFDSVNPML